MVQWIRNSDFGEWLRTSGDDAILWVLVPIIAIWCIWVCREGIAEWWKNRGKTPEEIEADAELTPEEMEIEYAQLRALKDDLEGEKYYKHLEQILRKLSRIYFPKNPDQ
jgi:hypothetical protein